MPTKLKSLVEEAAAANGRSINVQVVSHLEESFATPALACGPRTNVDSLANTVAERVVSKL